MTCGLVPSGIWQDHESADESKLALFNRLPSLVPTPTNEVEATTV
jgi:hypothetical protein